MKQCLKLETIILCTAADRIMCPVVLQQVVQYILLLTISGKLLTFSILKRIVQVLEKKKSSCENRTYIDRTHKVETTNNPRLPSIP